MVWNMGKANTIILKENFILAIGLKIKSMDRANISMKTAESTPDLLPTIWNMESEESMKLMAAITKGSFMKTINMELLSTSTQKKIKNIY